MFLSFGFVSDFVFRISCFFCVSNLVAANVCAVPYVLVVRSEIQLPSVVHTFRRPFSLKMVFAATHAVRQLMRSQFEHTLAAGKQFFAACEYL